jgi:putative restriction endonuclease
MKFVIKIGRRTSLEFPLELSFLFKPQARHDSAPFLHDWVIYYRSRLAGTRDFRLAGDSGYFAVAYVDRVERHGDSGLLRADVTSFTPFDRTVPFRIDDVHFESRATHRDGTMNGALIQRDARPIDDGDFLRIVRYGLVPEIGPEAGLSEPGPMLDVAEEVERLIVRELRNTRVRDRRFADQICRLYGYRCALTGMSLIDPSGQSDLEAAHIKPVSRGGPDSVRNGFACIASVHKLFDLGWFTIGDDLEIIVSDFARGHPVLAQLAPGNRLHVSEVAEHRPHPSFLRFHREFVFEQWTKGTVQAPYLAG